MLSVYKPEDSRRMQLDHQGTPYSYRIVYYRRLRTKTSSRINASKPVGPSRLNSLQAC